jgi:hypothetical protein
MKKSGLFYFSMINGYDNIQSAESNFLIKRQKVPDFFNQLIEFLHERIGFDRSKMDQFKQFKEKGVNLNLVNQIGTMFGVNFYEKHEDIVYFYTTDVEHSFYKSTPVYYKDFFLKTVEKYAEPGSQVILLPESLNFMQTIKLTLNDKNQFTYELNLPICYNIEEVVNLLKEKYPSTATLDTIIKGEAFKKSLQ